jgi:hypothetical protein
VPVYNPTGSGNVHIDQILTQISVAWPNNGLVGENLFPSVPVRKQSDKYYVFGREAWLVENDVRAPGTAANEITGFQLSTDTYYAQEHSLQLPVTDEERWNSDSPLAPDRDAAELVSSDLIGAILGIPKLIVPGVGIGNTLLGQPIGVGYLWGKDVILAYVPPRPGLRIAAYGYEFAWSGSPGGQVQYVDRWREEQRKSDLVRVCRYYDLKLVAQGDGAVGTAGKAIAGYLIKTAVA